MKKIFFSILFGAMLFSNASADENTKVIVATKDIKYLSQKIAKNYLYLYINPKKIVKKIELTNDIKKLEENFRFVAKNSDNDDIKNILDFLSYSKDQIKEVLSKDISIEKTALMLDYSETLFEGAQSILDTYQYDFDNDKDIKTHLMKISKFYIAREIEINLSIDKEQLQLEIDIIDKKLNANGNNSKDSWYALKDFLSTEDYFVPEIVSILIKDIHNTTEKYEKYN